MRRTACLAVLTAAALLALSAPAEDKQVRLEVVITAEETGQPIENAVVYVKFKEERALRKDKRQEWSNKTNHDGQVGFPLLPEGQVLVQVIAKGWKTYGRFYDLRGPQHILEIKLKPSKKWY